MSLTLAAAAVAVGLHKTTLLRAIKGGKISATKDAHGEWQVEPAELHRVYPATDEGKFTGAPTALEAEIAGLRQIAELLRQELNDVRQDRDRWADAATAALRALPPPSSAAPRPRFWWSWRRAG